MKTILLFLALVTFSAAATASTSALPERPKLIVLIVIDQFRADYLTRFESRFLPAKGKNGEVGGFRYLMSQGAYFPTAEYDILQSMTAPGHATVLTGAYPYQAGIPTNYWFNHKTGKRFYATEGSTPATLLGTTVGDEFKNAGYPSKVVTMALKDRSAVLMGGHRADLAFWFDPKAFGWTSGKYYLNDGKIPAWMEELNRELQKKKGQKFVWNAEGPGSGLSAPDATDHLKLELEIGKKFPHVLTIGSNETFVTPFGFDVMVAAAIRAFDAFKMGEGKGPNLFAVSFSGHDYAGHVFGPNAREMEELTVYEDKVIARLLNHVRKATQGGLKDVVLVLTADHGSPSSVDWLAAHHVPAGRIDEAALAARIGARLEVKYGKPAKGSWVPMAKDLNVYLNHGEVEAKGLSLQDVQSEAKQALEGAEGIAHVVTGADVAHRKLPAGMHERQILKTYFPGRSGDLVIIPRPYYFSLDDEPVLHMTGYTYDRTVPIIFAGKHIRPGIYASKAEVVDIAPTLSFLSFILAPSLSEGRVLKEALSFVK